MLHIPLTQGPTNVTSRPLSEDGMWEWDGTAWQPSHAHPDSVRARTLDTTPTEHTGTHRDTVEFDREKWERDREHLQVRGVIFSNEKEIDESGGRGRLFAIVGVAGVVVAGAVVGAWSFFGGSTAAGSPEDTVRDWHNAIIAGDTNEACALTGASAFTETKTATGTPPSCVAALQAASTSAMATGAGIVTDVTMKVTETTATADVTYADTKEASFTLTQVDDAWVIESWTGGPADFTGRDSSVLAPAKGNEAEQAEELLAELEANDAN